MTYKYGNVILDTSELMHRIPPKDDGTPPDLRVGGFMAELIDTLAVKYPLWLFELSYISSVSNDTVEAVRFDVFNEDNPRKQVGWVSISSRYVQGIRETVYAVGGERVTQMRERGSDIHTKFVKVAVKAVNKYFTPAPLDERLPQVQVSGSRVIHYALQKAKSDVACNQQDIQHAFDKFIEANWSMFLSGLNPQELELAIERVELARSCEELSKLHHETLNKQNMLTLIIENDKYIVQSIKGISVYSSEELPEEVRMKIGMLKLTDIQEVLPNIGVRTNNGYLIVLDNNQGA